MLRRGGAPLCNLGRCGRAATRHVEYRTGGTYVKNHFCSRHATSEAAAFERVLGVSATSRALDDACRRGSC